LAILFSNNTVIKIKNIRVLKNWIAETIVKEKKIIGEIHFNFINDKELLSINQEFLKHNTLTDIITFDYCEGKQINGEIYISIERVKENALRFNVSFQKEIQRVIIHGVLHLCGLKDKSKAEKEKIRKKEDACLKLLSSKSV
jgi:rRNA maturation RNase YbeY